jgi:serine/threonine protein kinase
MAHWQLKNEEAISQGDTFMFGRYTVVEKVGSGGQGKVYLIEDNQEDAAKYVQYRRRRQQRWEMKRLAKINFNK